MREHSTFDKDFWKYFGCFISIIVLICFLPWAFTSFSLLNFTDKGPIGDTIGGIMGPFVAIAAAGLTFIAFWVQYKANIQQRHDIAIERFESNLFEMIHIQQEITNGLLIEEIGNIVGPQRGRDVFQFAYETGKDKILVRGEMRKCTLKEALSLDDQIKLSISSLKNMWFLDHYFRHLYRIFKYIDGADDLFVSQKKKYEYASIVRATLSQYELIMLFYNGFYHQKFKKLIEKYTILKNIRTGLLASYEDNVLYGSKFSPLYSYEKDEGRNMELEYKKLAFVHQS